MLQRITILVTEKKAYVGVGHVHLGDKKMKTTEVSSSKGASTLKSRTLAGLITALAVAIALPPLSAAAQVSAPEPKAIVIRDTASNTLGFRVELEKTNYAVNESIRFSVRAEKPFFLYVYNSDATGKSTLIYPNKREPLTQLAARTRHELPSKVEFASDRVGVENLVFIASTSKLDTAQMKSQGDFFVAQEADLVGAMEAKGIVIRDRREAAPAGSADTVVRTATLKISAQRAGTTAARPAPPRPPQAEPAPVANPDPATFVTSDRTSYKVGQPMSVTFGATQKGFVHLFVSYPDGTAERVLTRAVEANVPQTLDAVAVLPAGRQTLVAAFSKTATLDDAFLERLGTEDDAQQKVNKGVRIAGVRASATQPEVPLSSRNIRVAE